MIWPGRNSRLIAVTFATRQTIDFRVKQVHMLCGHSRRTMYFASIAAGAQTLHTRPSATRRDRCPYTHGRTSAYTLRAAAAELNSPDVIFIEVVILRSGGSIPLKSRAYSRGRRSRCRQFGGARHRALGLLSFFINELAIGIAAAPRGPVVGEAFVREADRAKGDGRADGTVQERQSHSCPAASSQSRSISASGERLFAWISQ